MQLSLSRASPCPAWWTPKLSGPASLAGAHASMDKSPCSARAYPGRQRHRAASRPRRPSNTQGHTGAQEMSVILGCIQKGGGRNVVTRPHGTGSPLQGCCLQCSHLRFQPEQENLERVQKRAGSESRQWKICITVTERRSSGCLVY